MPSSWSWRRRSPSSSMTNASRSTTGPARGACSPLRTSRRREQHGGGERVSGVRKRERREGSSTQTRRLQVQPREEEPRADLSLSESSGRAQDRYMTKSAGATLLRCSQQPCRFMPVTTSPTPRQQSSHRWSTRNSGCSAFTRANPAAARRRRARASPSRSCISSHGLAYTHRPCRLEKRERQPARTATLSFL